jgi:hypothetical protein
MNKKHQEPEVVTEEAPEVEPVEEQPESVEPEPTVNVLVTVVVTTANGERVAAGSELAEKVARKDVEKAVRDCTKTLLKDHPFHA